MRKITEQQIASLLGSAKSQNPNDLSFVFIAHFDANFDEWQKVFGENSADKLRDSVNDFITNSGDDVFIWEGGSSLRIDLDTQTINIECVPLQ